MDRLLIEEPINKLCEINADYQRALDFLSEDEEPNATEMKVFSRIEDKYMTALRKAVLFLVDEIKTIKKRRKKRDELYQCNYAIHTNEGKAENEYKLIVGKFTNSHRRIMGMNDQRYMFVLVPWEDNVAISWFKEKHRRIFYSSEAVDREVIDVRRYIYNNPTAAEVDDLLEYLEVLCDGADSMFEQMINPYTGA